MTTVKFQAAYNATYATFSRLRVNKMIKMQKHIDHSMNLQHAIHNITATLSALFPLIKGVSRNLGGFSLPEICRLKIRKKALMQQLLTGKRRVNIEQKDVT